MVASGERWTPQHVVVLMILWNEYPPDTGPAQRAREIALQLERSEASVMNAAIYYGIHVQASVRAAREEARRCAQQVRERCREVRRRIGWPSGD